MCAFSVKRIPSLAGGDFLLRAEVEVLSPVAMVEAVPLVISPVTYLCLSSQEAQPRVCDLNPAVIP